MSALASILDGKDKTIRSVGTGATVDEAVRIMCRTRVGALLVGEPTTPTGIITERDILVRVLLERREPTTTPVVEVMTRDVVCIGLDMEPEEAMTLMTERRVRHLPIVEGGLVIGIVSIGDLIRWASARQESEIRALNEYVCGPWTTTRKYARAG